MSMFHAQTAFLGISTVPVLLFTIRTIETQVVQLIQRAFLTLTDKIQSEFSLHNKNIYSYWLISSEKYFCILFII
jgi:hypothetical protein